MKNRTLFIFLLFVFPIIGNAKIQDEFLPKTIVFKVKEDYRKYCLKNEIAYSEFINFSNQIGLSSIEKIFPNKEKPQRENQTDLSLIYQLSYQNEMLEQKVITQLYNLGMVEYAELYIIPQLVYTPSDTDAVNTSRNWHLTMINAFQAWDVNKGDTNVIIGITDTGWDPTHIDLLGNCKKNYADPINGTDDDGDGYIDNFMGWDMGDNDNDATYTSNHGSHVAGLAAAVTDNVAGVASIGFNSKFLPIKISDNTGALTKAYQGVVYAADHGCFIINCSWGSYTPGYFQRDVINYAINDKGCLVIGACGNDNGEDIFYPAAYDGVLTVAASEQSDLKKNNSNYGYYVDISAPGEFMWSTISMASGGYGINGGTSMAAPVVAGAAALVKAQFPSYTNQQVAAQLEATAFNFYPNNPLYIDKLGSGRLDAFAALTNTSSQFIELIQKTITDQNDQIFEGGDTLNIVGDFMNYLDPLNGLTATLSSASPYVNVFDASTNLPNLNTLQSAQNNADAFKIEILNGAGLNEEILFQITISNGSYTKNEFFSIIINPDYINVEENLVSTTITSKGKIGYNDDNNAVGLGFYYRDEQLLYEAGLMVGDAVTRVADCVRAVSSIDHDFTSLLNVKFNPPYVSALDLIGTMKDINLGMELTIEQKTYAYPTSPDDKYVIVLYKIENTNTVPLNNIFLGIFADWDIQDPYKNKAGFDASRNMGYVYSLEQDTVYAAIKLLSSASAFNYSLDNITGGGGGVDISANNYTTAEKYQTLSTNRMSAGAPNGQDVAHVVSSGSFTLNPGEAETIAFAIIAGDSLTDIQTSADAAQTKYNVIGVEEINSENNFVIYPNPTKGLINIIGDEKVKSITIRNILGENILQTKQQEIELSSYPNGVYFIEIESDNERSIKKVLKTK